MSNLETGLLTVVLVMLVIDLIGIVGRGRIGADALVNERLEKLLRDDTAMRLMEKAYEEAGTAQRMVINTLADVVKVLAPITPIRTDDTVDRFFDDLLTPGAPDGPAGGGHGEEDPEPDPEPVGQGSTITVNPLLQNALDGTVDRGTDYRYQMRPLGWLVYWKKHPAHETPPYINQVQDGFRAELAFIGGKVGYVSELKHSLEPGHYLLKMVVDAHVINPPQNASDVNLRAALLRPDGSVMQELPGQPFARWQGENTYLMPIQVAAEGLDAKIAFYVDAQYPTLGLESAITFKELRLLTDDGGASDYVVV